MAGDSTRSVPFAFKLAAGLLLFVLTFFVAMTLGAAHTTPKEVWLAIMTDRPGENLSVLREIRLPREIAAVFIGAALAVSGSVMQGMTRNPLADPGLLGLTAGANAALAFTLALVPSANYFWITVACFVGAAAGSLLVAGIGAAKKGGFSPLRIVLAGSAVSAFLYALADGIGLAFKISKDVSMWTAGGIIGTSWEQLQVIIPFVSVGVLTAMALSRQLTILSLSEDIAVGLGQKTGAVKAALFVVTVLLAGASVALVGNLTFLGLMIPHIVRAVVGTDYRFVVPMSAVSGATFMLLADTLARTINAPYETPLAAIVAVAGLPFFLYIMRRGGKAIK